MADTKTDLRFIKGGAVQYGGRPYANTAVLVDYLARRLRVSLPPGATRNETEAQLRQWQDINDCNSDGLPWDIPSLATMVRGELEKEEAEVEKEAEDVEQATHSQEAAQAAEA